LIRANAKAVAGIDPVPVISLGGTDYAVVAVQRHPGDRLRPVTKRHGQHGRARDGRRILFTWEVHVLSAYDYLSRSG